ncbi:MAG: exonuclease domain-containing protein, partial [Mycobacterium leprae]
MAAMALPALPHFQPDADTGLGCILDTETTGLGSTDEAIELALLLFAYQRSTGTVLGVVDEYAGLREPTVPIQPGAEAVHGISAAEVRGQQLDYLRVESILARAEFIIAHNASFDYRFVCPLSETAKEKPWLCSMTGVDWYGKGFQSRALQRLLGEHKIRLPQAHRAMADVYGVLYLLT